MDQGKETKRMSISRKALLALVAVMTLTIGSSAVAYAITSGDPDDGEHPYVGLAVFYDESGGPLWRCSGTLLSPTLFLTAGHCTEPPAVRSAIWFEEDVESGMPDNGYPYGGGTSRPGTAHVHPDYDPSAFFLYDLGVVELDEPYLEVSEFGVLPAEGMLDELATGRGLKDTTFEAVGYGLQKINPVFYEGERIRLKATLNLVSLRGTAGTPRGTNMTVSGNAHTGGTCFGDSGGPQFYHVGDEKVVVAVTSWGLNGNCAGIGGAYRVDQEDDLGWLLSEFEDHLP